LNLFHLLLHSRSLFHQFSNTGHSRLGAGLGADLDNLAFEHFQCLLN
jgi:hypothetical protein